MNTDRRKQLLKLIHVGRRELGMDDDAYRAMLQSLEKVNSAADLTIPGMEKVLEHMKRCGFKVRSKTPGRAKASDAQSRMIRGLWLELAEKGIVRHADESALVAFVKRMTGTEALQWLKPQQASKVIEELKKWRNRTEEQA